MLSIAQKPSIPFKERIQSMGTSSLLDQDAIKAMCSLENGFYPEELKIEPT